MARTDMDLEAEELRLVDLLGENTRIFQTPIFQREYKWELEQRKALWDDVNTIGNQKDSHFFGQVILVEDEDEGDVQVYKIVDGQQRITTFSILVCAIRDALNLPDSQNNVKSILTTHDQNGETVRTLHLLEADDDCYEKIYKGNVDQTDPDHPIRECYDFFTEKIAELSEEDCEELLKKTVHQVNLVRTSCGSMTAAYQVFQTQNERGLPLTPINLAKTKLLEKASNADMDEESIRRRWKEMSTQLEENDRVSSAAPRRAITHYLIVDDRYEARGHITARHFYDVFTNALEQHDEAEGIRNFIESLEDYTDRYINIHEGAVRKYRRHNRNRINRQMRFFQSKNAHAPVALLYLVENVDRADELEELLQLANKLSVRLNLEDASPAYKRDSMYQLVSCLKDAKRSNWKSEIKERIKDRTIEDEELFEQLKVRELPNSRFTRNMLRTLEEDYYQRRTPETQVDLDRVELEHIAPRRALSSDGYSSWQAVFKNNEEKFERYKSRLGNLTLLADEQNGRASDDTFPEKCKHYRRSDIQMTKEIPENYRDWGFEEIEERTEKIARDIIDYWGIN